MTLADAESLAGSIAVHIAPYCKRVEIAGSIRRRKGNVHDIDVVVVPIQTREENLFGEPADLCRPLYQALKKGTTTDDFDLQWIKPSAADDPTQRDSGQSGAIRLIPWPITEGGRRWCGWEKRRGIKVEFYLTDPNRFGATLLIRTGSGDFSKAIVTHARSRGLRFQGGELLDKKGNPIAVPEEADVFRALGLAYVHPEDRHDLKQIRNQEYK